MSRASVVVALLLACTPGNYRAEFHTPEQLANPAEAATADTVAAAFVKLHTHDGRVYVLDEWHFDEGARQVVGHGLLYSSNRVLLSKGQVSVPYTEVELVETNQPERVVHATSLAIMGVVAAAVPIVGAVCLANPKSCFGSCPTFYVHDGDALDLRAEGFSAAIVRALEQRDIDHLGVVDPPAGRFELVMANEALETHFLRSVELISVPRPSSSASAGDSEVFHTREGFIGVHDLRAPSACVGLARDCLDDVRAADRLEYSSKTDGLDLAARERIELEFPAAGVPEGAELVVIVRARNTLLDTFLFYQALAYIGGEAARWFLDEPDAGAWSVLRGDFTKLLGDIDVEQWDGHAWVSGGRVRELGPIARETQAVVLPKLARAAGQPIRLRLNLTRGRWKIDRVALAQSLGPLEGVRLQPQSLVRDGELEPEKLAVLLDPQQHLLSYPGDVWVIGFELPQGPQTLFLAAEGFYLEWMRDEWVAEQDLVEAARFFLTPAATLRRLAPVYHAVEDELAPVFWETRIRPIPLRGATGAEP